MTTETVSTGEQYTAPTTPLVVIDLAKLHDMLVKPLQGCGEQIAIEFGGKIEEALGHNEILVFDSEAARMYVKAGLTSVAEGVWAQTRTASLGIVTHKDFPQNNSGLPPVLSGRAYQRANGLTDSRQRSELQVIQTEAKKCMVAALTKDISSQEPQIPEVVDEISEITESEMHSHANNSASQVACAVSTLEQLLLQNPEAYPPLPVIQSRWITALAFGRRQAPIEEPQSPSPTINRKELARAIANLRDVVSATRATFQTMPDAKVREYSRCVREATELVADDYFFNLQIQYVSELNADLQTAYDEHACQEPATTRQEQDAPGNPKRKRIFGSEKNNPCTDIIDITDDTREVSQLLSESEIGTLLQPFDWLHPDTAIPFQRVRTPSGEIVFCEAMSPRHKEISESVRKQTESGKKLPEIIKRIKIVEAEGNAITHKPINTTHGFTVDGHPLLYYKINSSNGARTYYIRSTVGSYPQVSDLSEQHGIAPETPLIIVVGETDKQHQATLFTLFGGKQRRLGNAGVKK